MDVFLPVLHLRDQPRMDIALARMVQLFAEEVGLPALQHYDEVKPSGRKSKVVASIPPRADTQPLIPPSDTTWHTFYGREPGALEQLISRQIAATGAMPQIVSTTPRPLSSPPSPTVFSPAPSTANMPRGALEANSSPWTAEDLKYYAVRLKGCDEAGRRAIIEQVSIHLTDIFAVIRDLERRVEDLELIKAMQTSEIEGLREAFRDAMDSQC